MITPEQGFTRLQQCVATYRHPHYKHCKEYAEELSQMCGSLNVEALIQKFDLREDEDAFQNRVKLSQNILLPVANKIQKPFAKALRADDIQVSTDKPDDLTTVVNNFYGEDDLRKYLDQHLVNWLFSDPNGWLFLDILEFNANREKPKIYPKFIESKDALDYGYYNNTPDYLVCRIESDYHFIHKAIGIVLKPTKGETTLEYKEGEPVQLSFVQTGTLIKISGTVYEVTLTDPKLSRTPCRQVGYQKDPFTQHKTFISPLHAAIPTMRRAIRFGSELDVSIHLHVFPKKYVVEKPCTGCFVDDHHVNCKNGYVTTEGGKTITCTNCGGSGLQPYHTSAQDIIGVPEELIKSGEVKLTDLTHYEATDVETPTFLKDFVKELSDQCLTDIFQTNYFSMANERTATEINTSYDDVYDTLFAFTHGYSSLWKFCVQVAGNYKDVEFTQVEMTFPRDLQLQSLDELITAYKNSEGAPMDVRESIGKKILRASHRNDSNDYERALIKRSLEPFANKSSTEVQTIISNNLASPFKTWLWGNFEEVFEKFEDQAGIEPIKVMLPKKRKEEFETFARAIYEAEMSVDINLVDNSGDPADPNI